MKMLVFRYYPNHNSRAVLSAKTLHFAGLARMKRFSISWIWKKRDCWGAGTILDLAQMIRLLSIQFLVGRKYHIFGSENEPVFDGEVDISSISYRYRLELAGIPPFIIAQWLGIILAVTRY